MSKNKFKVISILIAIILLLSTTLVFAENESDVIAISEDPNSATEAVAENQNTNTNTSDGATAEDQAAATTSEENFKKGDVYLTGDNVTVDYVVDGNVFIVANTVTINSQIGGDAFICASSITVGEQGYVFSNLFALAQTLDIKGVVYDVYALSQDVTVSGYVYRDVKASCKNLNIYGTVGRNAFVKCSNINFLQNTNTGDEANAVTSQGMISGDLNYSSDKELSIQEGTVNGSTNYTPMAKAGNNTVSTYLLSLGAFIATSILVWLICLWLAPKFLNNVSDSLTSKKILPVIGLGILTPIAVSIACIILLILGVTAGVGLLLLSLLFIIIGISSAIFTIAINKLVCAKLKIDKTIGFFGMLIATSAVIWAVELIPYVGSIVGLIAVIIGLGLVVSKLVLKDKKTDNTKIEKTEKK